MEEELNLRHHRGLNGCAMARCRLTSLGPTVWMQRLSAAWTARRLEGVWAFDRLNSIWRHRAEVAEIRPIPPQCIKHGLTAYPSSSAAGTLSLTQSSHRTKRSSSFGISTVSRIESSRYRRQFHPHQFGSLTVVSQTTGQLGVSRGFAIGLRPSVRIVPRSRRRRLAVK